MEPLDPVTEPAAPPFSRLQEMLLTAESSSSGRIVVGQASVGQSVLCTDFELHVKVSDYNAAVHQVRVIAGSDPSTGEQSATGDAAAASTLRPTPTTAKASEADSSAQIAKEAAIRDRAAWARSVLESDPSLVHLVACGEATNFELWKGEPRLERAAGHGRRSLQVLLRDGRRGGAHLCRRPSRRRGVLCLGAALPAEHRRVLSKPRILEPRLGPHSHHSAQRRRRHSLHGDSGVILAAHSDDAAHYNRGVGSGDDTDRRGGGGGGGGGGANDSKAHR